MDKHLQFQSHVFHYDRGYSPKKENHKSHAFIRSIRSHKVHKFSGLTKAEKSSQRQFCSLLSQYHIFIHEIPFHEFLGQFPQFP